MGTFVELTAADGHRLAAYRCEPLGKPRGGLVIVQEIFGVNSHIRAVADGYAADGYLVIAPAMFDRIQRNYETGYTQPEIEASRALIPKAGLDDAIKDVAAAVKAAQVAGKVGIVGYCWGGLLTWRSACMLKGLSAAVPYYGGGMTVGDDAGRKPTVPVMAHFGDQDHWIPLDTVEAFKKAQPGVAVHVYQANHGFNCDQRGSYNEAAATLAKQRTLAFFAKHLG